MRQLTLKQAQSCETATTKRCRCRCGGALHGIARDPGAVYDREFFEQLPDNDLHHLSPKPVKSS